MSGSNGRTSGRLRLPELTAALVALSLAAFGVVKGTWAVGGSDSSCYGLMADAFAHGHLQPVTGLPVDAPWPNASRTFAPAGFIPSPTRAGAASPVCAPGVSVLMAPLARLFGRDGMFWLTPLAAAALVYLAFVLARRLAGSLAGVVAAILTASSPIVLFQSVQPMSDVVSAALWMAAFVISTSESPTRAWWAGLATGAAILVRPNLAPIALVPIFACGWQPRTIANFCVAAFPGAAILIALNTSLYGSPVSSGYGDPRQLFSVAYVPENLRNYGKAMYETQTLLPLVALAAPLVFTGPARRTALAALGMTTAVFALYVFYQPFPEWWYLRFLLTGIVLAIALASASVVRVALDVKMGGIVAIATVILALAGVRTARDRQAFDLQRLEGRFRRVGTIVSERLPENAVLITVWESGSIRFHAARDVVLWDSLAPEWLDRAVAWLNEHGRPAYILVERREENDFRARFRDQSSLGALDWPPRFDVNRQVRLFDTADRNRHIAGELYATENVR